MSVTVLDVNDCSPEFTQPSYDVPLREDAPPGSSVIQLTATDPDEGSTVQYSITGGNHKNSFRIDSSGKHWVPWMSMYAD